MPRLMTRQIINWVSHCRIREISLQENWFEEVNCERWFLHITDVLLPRTLGNSRYGGCYNGLDARHLRKPRYTFTHHRIHQPEVLICPQSRVPNKDSECVADWILCILRCFILKDKYGCQFGVSELRSLVAIVVVSDRVMDIKAIIRQERTTALHPWISSPREGLSLFRFVNNSISEVDPKSVWGAARC